MKIISILGELLGIGKGYLNKRSEIKLLKQKHEFSILEAQTKAQVDRIMSNTSSDNDIDLITARQKSSTLKDDIVTYLFLVPVVIATVTPFIIAFKINDFTQLSVDIEESYKNLDSLPEWYKYVLAAVIIDVLGFRSFARKLLDKWTFKKK